MKLKTVIKIYSPEDILNMVTGGTFSGPKLNHRSKPLPNFVLDTLSKLIFSG